MAAPLLRGRTYRHRATQRGAMLLSVLFAIGIGATVLIAYLRVEERRQLMNVGAVEGEVLSQFAVGLRGFMAAAQATPALLPPAPMVGVDWLKSPACGGRPGNPESGHVPCNFSGGTFGPLYRTSFTHNPVTGLMEMRTSFVVPRFGGARDAGTTNRNAIMISERLVRAALAGQANPANGVFFSAFANVAEAANAPHDATTGPPGGNSGRVVVVVTNAPSHDIFLRTDGTNRMLANLNVGGHSIANARDGRFSGDVRIDERLQVRAGITVTEGPADFRQGVVTNDIVLTSIGKHLSEGFYDAVVYTGASSYVIAKPDCSEAGGAAGIYTSLQGTGTPNDAGYTGDALYAARVDVTDQGATWLVEPVIQATRFNLSRAGTNIVLDKTVHNASALSQRILVMRRCR